MASFLTSKPKLTGAISLLSLGSLTLYITKKQLDKTCPRVPITQLPTSSASRNLIESGEPSSGLEKPWGRDKSVLLSSWPGGEEEGKTRWMPSFVALQVDVPIAQLERYYQYDEDNEDWEKTKDVYPQSQNFMRAFLHGRAKGPERFFLDRDVPPFSYAPGTHLFGRREFGAFMLGAWSSTRQMPFMRPDLPSGPPLPPSEFPSNEQAISRAQQTSEIDAAGTVIYWTFPKSLINAVNKAAAYYAPWRLMDGGFQEFIVERVSDETARVTYVTLECSDLYPDSANMGCGGGERERDFKKLPGWFYEFHVLYAQVLLWRTLRQLRG
ncbi:uncharacterized protein BDV14DRAFT_78504 [Aspergillus stella-maris]|uniref:uncharacterized protein n=1 Tax=Aspergillus stella-maris TaxID=1810926 RepID=UPI003CCD5469